MPYPWHKGPLTQAPLATPDTGPQNTPPIWYGDQRQGTYLDFFDLSMAIAPGLSEATRLGQIAKALAYWQAEQAAPSSPYTVALAATAVTWLTAEQTRVSRPPTNSLSVVYPV